MLILAFSVLQIITITPIVQRYTRHALTLYPLVCILAGMGLWLLTDVLRSIINWVSARRQNVFPEKLRLSKPSLISATPVLVLAVFLLLNFQQFSYTIDYIRRAIHFKPVQVQAAEYLSQVMQPGDKVGILDLIPWMSSDLKSRHISFEQIKLSYTPQALKARGITYVVGTDRIRADYGKAAGTMWSDDFEKPGSKLAEFGTSWLAYMGYPVNYLYIFVARLPGD